MALEVGLGERRAVGATVEIDLPVAERAPHGLDVIGCDARRVETRIAAELLEAPPEIRGHGRCIVRRNSFVGASERSRSTRPALIDHDDISEAPHLGEELVHLYGRSRRSD